MGLSLEDVYGKQPEPDTSTYAPPQKKSISLDEYYHPEPPPAQEGPTHAEGMNALLGQEDRAGLFRSLDATNRLESREQDADAWAQEVVPGAAPGPVAEPVSEPAPGPVAEDPGTNPYRMSQEQAYAEADEIDAGTNVLYEDIESSPAPPGVTHDNVFDTIFDQPQPENRVTKTIEGMLRDGGAAVGNYASVLAHEAGDIGMSIAAAGPEQLAGLLHTATAIGRTGEIIRPMLGLAASAGQTLGQPDVSGQADLGGVLAQHHAEAISRAAGPQTDVTHSLRQGRRYLIEKADELRPKNPSFAAEVAGSVASMPAALIEIVGTLATLGPGGLVVLEAMKHGIDPDTGEVQSPLEWAKGSGYGLFLAKLFPWIGRAGSGKTLALRSGAGMSGMEVAAWFASKEDTMPPPTLRSLGVSFVTGLILVAPGMRGHGKRRKVERMIEGMELDKLAPLRQQMVTAGQRSVVKMIDKNIESRSEDVEKWVRQARTVSQKPGPPSPSWVREPERALSGPSPLPTPVLDTAILLSGERSPALWHREAREAEINNARARINEVREAAKAQDEIGQQVPMDAPKGPAAEVAPTEPVATPVVPTPELPADLFPGTPDPVRRPRNLEGEPVEQVRMEEPTPSLVPRVPTQPRGRVVTEQALKPETLRDRLSPEETPPWQDQIASPRDLARLGGTEGAEITLETSREGADTQARDFGDQTSTARRPPSPTGGPSNLYASPSYKPGPAMTRVPGLTVELGTFSDFVDPKTGKRKVHLQGTNNLAALILAHRGGFPAAKEFIADTVRDISGAKFYETPELNHTEGRLKKRQSLEDKIESRREEGVPEQPLSTYSDFTGFRIIIEDVKAIPEILRRFRDQGRLVEGIDDFLTGVRSKGNYKAIHLQVATGRGMSVEVQLVPRHGMIASEGNANGAFDAWMPKVTFLDGTEGRRPAHKAYKDPVKVEIEKKVARDEVLTAEEVAALDTIRLEAETTNKAGFDAFVAETKPDLAGLQKEIASLGVELPLGTGDVLYHAGKGSRMQGESGFDLRAGEPFLLETRQAAVDRVTGEGGGARGVHEFTLESEKPYLKDGRILDERDAEGRTELSRIQNELSEREKLLREGYDAVPYFNEADGSLSWMVLDPTRTPDVLKPTGSVETGKRLSGMATAATEVMRSVQGPVEEAAEATGEAPKRSAPAPIEALPPDAPPPKGDKFIPFARDTGGTEGFKPATKNYVKRRGKILRRWAKDMGLAVVWGRMEQQPKGVEGLYDVGGRGVRVRRAYDMETIAHEFAHDMWSEVPEIRLTLEENSAFRRELAETGYEKGNVAEGWADWVRVLATRPVDAKLIAPDTFKWFDGRAEVGDKFPKGSVLSRNKKIGKAFRRAQSDMMDWFSSDPKVRGELLVGKEEPLGNIFDDWGTGVRQGYFDEAAGIENAERRLNSGRLLPAGVSPYTLARLSKARVKLVEGAIERALPVWKEKDGQPYIRFEGGEPIAAVLRDVRKSGSTPEEFFNYMTGRRAHRLKQEGRENLLPDDVIKAWMDLGVENSSLPALAERYQKWNHGLIDFATGAGVLSPAAAARLKKDFYFPFYRHKGEADIRGGSTRTTRPGEVKPVHRLRGGTENLKAGFERMLMNADKWIEMSVVNEAMGRVAGLEKLPGGKNFVRELDPGSVEVKRLTASVKAAFWDSYRDNRTIELLEQAGGQRKARRGPIKGYREERGELVWGEIKGGEIELQIDRELAQLDHMWDVLGDSFTLSNRAAVPEGSDVFVHLVNGKAKYYQALSPLLTRALVALHGGKKSREPKSRGRLGMESLNRLWKASITHWPTFAPKALFRDVEASMVFRKHGFTPLVDTLRGLHHSVFKTEAYWKAVADGATLSGIYTPDNVRRAIHGRLERKYNWTARSIIDTPKKFADFYVQLLQATESATRVGAHMRARGGTVFLPSSRTPAHPREAGLLGREIATDFAMRGDAPHLQLLLDTAGFFRPGMAGLDRAYRGLFSNRGERARAWQGMAALGAISAVNTFYNVGNPLYDMLTEEMKRGYTHFIFRDPSYTSDDPRTDEELMAAVHKVEPGKREGHQAFAELRARYAHYKFPKAWEVGTGMTIFELTTEALMKKEFRHLAPETLHAIIENFKLLPFPTGTEALLESGFNVDFHTWSRITPEHVKGKQGVPAGLRAQPWLGPTVKRLGMESMVRGSQLVDKETPLIGGLAGGISPNEIQHYISSIFNQAGYLFLNWSDKKFFDDHRSELPGSSFWGRGWQQQARGLRGGSRKLHEILETYEQLSNSVKVMKELHGEKEALEWQDMNEKSLGLLTSKEIDGVKYLGLRDAFESASEMNKMAQEIATRADYTMVDLRKWSKKFFREYAAPGEEKRMRASGAWDDAPKLKAALIDRLQVGANIVAQRGLEDFWKRHDADFEGEE